MPDYEVSWARAYHDMREGSDYDPSYFTEDDTNDDTAIDDADGDGR